MLQHSPRQLLQPRGLHPQLHHLQQQEEGALHQTEEETQVSTRHELAVALPYLPHTHSSSHSSRSYRHSSSVALTTQATGLLHLQWAGRDHTRLLGVGPRAVTGPPLPTHSPVGSRHSEYPLAAAPSQGERVVCEVLA